MSEQITNENNNNKLKTLPTIYFYLEGAGYSFDELFQILLKYYIVNIHTVFIMFYVCILYTNCITISISRSYRSKAFPKQCMSSIAIDK